MPSQLTVGAILALLLTVAGLGWLVLEQRADLGAAEQTQATLQAQARSWQLALEEQTRHAAQVVAELSTSQRGYDELRRTTNKRLVAYEQTLLADKYAVGWDAVGVPFVVASRLCTYRDGGAGEAGLSDSSTAVHGPVADPTSCRFTNGDLWRWTEQLIEVIDRANADRVSVSAIWGNKNKFSSPSSVK